MTDRDDRPVVVVGDGGGASGVKWLLLGAALGAGLALLLAPADGAETRRRLARKVKALGESARGVVEELRDDGDEGDEGTMRRGDDGEGEARRTTAISAAREELERRLAAVRARRQQPPPEDEEPVA